MYVTCSAWGLRRGAGLGECLFPGMGAGLGPSIFRESPVTQATALSVEEGDGSLEPAQD